MKKCYIVGAGEGGDISFAPDKEDFVIAADGGIFPLLDRGIRADLLIGDLDSLKIVGGAKEKAESLLEKSGISGERTAVITLPKEKDDTDMLAAVREGIRAGCQEFHLYGGTGGRMDHTIANIQTLAYLAECGLRGFLHGRESVITLIKDGEILFDREHTGYISVFSYTEKALGVWIQGLKYELFGAELTSDFPIGTSNEFIGRESRIAVEKGSLLITFPPR